jgi:hypothetical protein
VTWAPLFTPYPFTDKKTRARHTKSIFKVIKTSAGCSLIEIWSLQLQNLALKGLLFVHVLINEKDINFKKEKKPAGLLKVARGKLLQGKMATR